MISYSIVNKIRLLHNEYSSIRLCTNKRLLLEYEKSQVKSNEVTNLKIFRCQIRLLSSILS